MNVAPKLATRVGALAFTLLSTAHAGPTLLSFDTVTSFAPIAAHYAGGADGAGAIGTNLGILFAPDALALANDVLGPYYSNAPTPAAVMVPVGNAATMNAATGVTFIGALSFFYSSSVALADAVQVWSGLDGAGTLLASVALKNNAKAGGCSDSEFCNFTQVTLPFSGEARSVSFGRAANVAAFDNLGLTTVGLPSTVSEPTTAAMVALALFGLAATRRRS